MILAWASPFKCHTFGAVARGSEAHLQMCEHLIKTHHYIIGFVRPLYYILYDIYYTTF